jgi:phosphatidylinositol phospholipase C delta
VQHIEAVREGHQSEGLRRFGGAFAPARCLTIAFKGRRKNLDLAAPTAEEAQRWVRGLAKLRARLDAMSQRERLDQYPARARREDAPCTAPVPGEPWLSP